MPRHCATRGTGLATIATALLLGSAASADIVHARCDIYPSGSRRATKVVGCDYSQVQGTVSIDRADGISYRLTPLADQPNAYKDAKGRAARRHDGLGDLGTIYRFEDESLFVYWSRDGMASAAADAESYSKLSRTRIPCSLRKPKRDKQCDAGISHSGPGAATLYIRLPNGQERVLNFASGKVTTPDGAVVKADKQENGDWNVDVGREFYQVPKAAIEAN